MVNFFDAHHGSIALRGDAAQHTGEPDQVACALARDPLPARGLGAVAYFEATLAAVRPPPNDFQPTVAVGVTEGAPQAARDWMPGWDAHSFGLHSDDGCAYYRNRTVPCAGRPLVEGDVVGCGILDDGSVFFTLDGELLGVPFPRRRFRSDAELRVAVGLDSPSVVVVNTGRFPLRARLERVVAAAREAVEAAYAPALRPLTEALVRRVLGMAVARPADLAGFSAVNRRARALGDRAADEVFEQLSRKRWPFLQTRAVPMRNWRRFYRRRAKRLEKPGRHSAPIEIENCALQTRFAHNGLPSQFMWELECPVNADMLRPAGEGRVFCNVCSEHVYSVKNEEELALRVDQGQCVAIDFQGRLETEIPVRPVGVRRGRVRR